MSVNNSTTTTTHKHEAVKNPNQSCPFSPNYKKQNNKIIYAGYDHQSIFTNLQTQGIAREDSHTMHIENVEHF